MAAAIIAFETSIRQFERTVSDIPLPAAILFPNHGYVVGIWTTSRRLADRKVMKFEKNIKKRGAIGETTKKKGSSYPVGPLVIGSVPDHPNCDKWRHGLNKAQ
ncbi:stress associated endoplasmic reticulum protein [Striga asiatica]|uniref:Stress associated endoplasmic reticulum protein n=1 Tax=Striga asiatica TaxID=4170 RepID=A0A5A7QGF6_STRAF|nr:stress associated endoplasmic reticulum protein [Striga asiatica]